jgi:hypothetical protein
MSESSPSTLLIPRNNCTAFEALQWQCAHVRTTDEVWEVRMTRQLAAGAFVKHATRRSIEVNNAVGVRGHATSQ